MKRGVTNPNFQIHRQIGEGGFGRVFEASYLKSNLKVALKVSLKGVKG